MKKKLVFSSFKIGNMFGVKDPILAGTIHTWIISLHVQAVMAVTSAKHPSIFPHVGESIILSSDKASYIFKHLQNSQHCRTLCLADCFHVLDHASSSFQRKIKEANIFKENNPL